MVTQNQEPIDNETESFGGLMAVAEILEQEQGEKDGGLTPEQEKGITRLLEGNQNIAE